MFILVTGGSASGKSEYAEQRAVEFGDPVRYYIATMMCHDEESRKRVQRHQLLRSGKHFKTIECFYNLKELELPQEVENRSTILLECMSNLAANEMFDPGGSGEKALAEMKTGIDRLVRKCNNLVVVTNEVFSDGQRYDSETERYQKVLGEINRYLGAIADEIVEVIYGIPVFAVRQDSGKMEVRD